MTNKILTSLLIFSLTSCLGGNKRGNETKALTKGSQNPNSKAYKAFVNRNCIKDLFSQGQDDNLYGLECIEGKILEIKTSKTGDFVSTSEVSNSEKDLKIDKNINFKNKFYRLSYNILKSKADATKIPFLLNFLPTNEEFYGKKDTKYRIIFKPQGNYLTLFKASKNLNDIPYRERTSLKVFRNGEMINYESDKEKKGDYYAVPFIGYPISYCRAETNINDNSGEKRFDNRANCTKTHLRNESYIKVGIHAKANYNFLTSFKKDLFPSNYFDGLWYFSSGPVESFLNVGEIAPGDAFLVKMEKANNKFNLRNMSGNVEERNREILGEIPVKWREFEADQKGNEQFVQFGEKNRDERDYSQRPYLQIDFNDIPGIESLVDLTLTKDYLSYTYKILFNDHVVKWKVSLRRAVSVDTAGFVPKRWFLSDQNQFFGFMLATPQDEAKQAEVTESELLDHFRKISFNTSLNTEEEKNSKTKTIKWHFSNNSTKDPEYREVAKKAVEIYDQAFKHISKNSDKKIRVKLIEDEEKDLGDLRYNIINLVKTRDIVAPTGPGILLGRAPSYVNPDTGQIIGTTANIFIHNKEKYSDTAVRNYIRYEIFQKDKKTEEENEIHATSPFLRSQIQNKCPEVNKFIQRIKEPSKPIKQNKELNDKEIIISCGKQITKLALLSLILHEMGHSFGLAHNFKASVDHKNYYQSKEEIKSIFPDIDHLDEEIAQFSSVMDYGHHESPPMLYLGKYDLTALRYLYLDEMESKDGTFFSMNTNPDVKQQKALTKERLQNGKDYQTCSDWQQARIPMCYLYDYGKNPEEIIKNDIASLKRRLNHFRYRYDKEELTFLQQIRFDGTYAIAFPGGILGLPALTRIQLLHEQWITLRDSYLNSIYQQNQFSYILNNSDIINRYKSTLKKGLAESEDLKTEYDLYHPIRTKLFETVMEILDLEEMKCHVTDSTGKEHRLALNYIRDLLKQNYVNNPYIEDCYSSQVLEFFQKNQLTFIKQAGYENFSSYLLRTGSATKYDVIPISQLLVNTRRILEDKTFVNTSVLTPGNIINTSFSRWIDEPDILKEFYLKSQKTLLDQEENKTLFDSLRATARFQTAILSLITILRSPDKRHYLAEHLENIQSVRFETGTDSDSFDNRVIEPLQRGISIQNIEIPFLIEFYNSNKNLELNKFENALKKKQEVFIDPAGQSFIIPFKTDNFSAKLIKKYNEVSEKLEKLEQKPNLSVLEAIHKEELNSYKEILPMIIDFTRKMTLESLVKAG